MRYAIKSKKKIVTAYQLGTGSEMERILIQEGTIVKHEDGTYELFSQEAKNGYGEVASAGDYFKFDYIDGKHYPYPNAKAWFEENHKHIQGDQYEQVQKPLMFWQADDPSCAEITYLLENGKMHINESDDTQYFNAFLWGAELSAAKDATVVFYEVTRDDRGNITDVSFNFIAKDQFEGDYTICG